MAGGHCFHSAGMGVMFATAVVINIFSAMLYDSIVKRRSKILTHQSLQDHLN